MSGHLRLGPEGGIELVASQFSLADIRRFWGKFPIGGDGCWLWTADTFDNGYGRFSMGRRYMAAHRVAYALAHGVVPAGIVVMHSCDVPTCVRVSHLRLGTQADNIEDARAKGRYHVAHPNKRRITIEQANEIRTSADRPSVLAKRFGVSITFVSAIRKGTKRQFDERLSA